MTRRRSELTKTWSFRVTAEVIFRMLLPYNTKQGQSQLGANVTAFPHFVQVQCRRREKGLFRVIQIYHRHCPLMQ